MRHIKLIEGFKGVPKNGAKKYPKGESIDALKDSLTELRDERTCYLPTNTATSRTINIFVKLENYYECDLVDGDMIMDLDFVKWGKSNEEVMMVLELLKEGIERSQIEYDSVIFNITNGYWDEITGSEDEGIIGEKEIDVIDVTILLK